MEENNKVAILQSCSKCGTVSRYWSLYCEGCKSYRNFINFDQNSDKLSGFFGVKDRDRL